MTLDEVREAIDKLTGAAINGSVVKVTPLVSVFYLLFYWGRLAVVCVGGGGS